MANSSKKLDIRLEQMSEAISSHSLLLIDLVWLSLIVIVCRLKPIRKILKWREKTERSWLPRRTLSSVPMTSCAVTLTWLENRLDRFIIQSHCIPLISFSLFTILLQSN